LRTQLGETRGANLFSVFSKIEIQDGFPQVVTRLAVAVRRKVIVFSWQDSEFMSTKVCMALTDNSMIAGNYRVL
jgi:hypothetical protein